MIVEDRTSERTVVNRLPFMAEFIGVRYLFEDGCARSRAECSGVNRDGSHRAVIRAFRKNDQVEGSVRARARTVRIVSEFDLI